MSGPLQAQGQGVGRAPAGVKASAAASRASRGSGQEGRAPEPMSVEAAYDRCLAIAREHYENFPVVSRFLPRSSRRALAAVYAFARAADDFADEGHGPGGPSSEERLEALLAWERLLAEAVAKRSRTSSRSNQPSGEGVERVSSPDDSLRRDSDRTDLVRIDPGHRGTGPVEPSRAESRAGRFAPTFDAGLFAGAFTDADAIFLALGDAIDRHAIPASHFLDLLSAFRQDVLVGRYETRAHADPAGAASRLKRYFAG